jgi:hypothetical protein
MATLDDLLVQETTLKNAMTQLFSQMQGMHISLATVRIHIAEIRNINRNSLTYNLPNEILSMIFEAGRSRTLYPASRDGRSKAGIPFELAVSSVSHRWRNVALQTPRLWTNLEIKVFDPTRCLTDLYLRRSKMSLLDITFRQRKSTNSNTNYFKAQLELLLPYVARWRSFIIVGVHFGSLSITLSPLAHLHAPALETLAMDCISNEQQVVETFSTGAPRLSSVALRSAFVRPPQGPALKFLQLCSDVRLSHVEFSQFMQSMPALTNISIHWAVVSDPVNYPAIQLPSVLSLDYHFDLLSNPGGVLPSLELPSLETLTIHGRTFRVIEVLTQHHRPYPFVQSLQFVDPYYTKRRDVPAATTLDFISLFQALKTSSGTVQIRSSSWTSSTIASQRTNYFGHSYRRLPSSLPTMLKLCGKSKHGLISPNSSRADFSSDIPSRGSNFRRKY